MKNTELLKILSSPPALYEPGEKSFWDDKHISASMLKNHLSHDTDGASRKHSFIKASVEWITKAAGNAKNKKLLDLGCGPGIYAELLHKKNFVVTGIDFSKRSINYAKKSAAANKYNIKYLYRNYLGISYKNEFDAAILIYCDFGVLSPQDRTAILNKVFSALKPGGIFITDVFTGKQYAAFKEGITASFENNGFWQAGKYVCIKNNRAYRKYKTYLEQYIVLSENGLKHYNLWNHAFTKQELTGMLRSAGFEKIVIYKDVKGNPFSINGKTLCVTARKPL